MFEVDLLRSSPEIIFFNLSETMKSLFSLTWKSLYAIAMITEACIGLLVFLNSNYTRMAKHLESWQMSKTRIFYLNLSNRYQELAQNKWPVMPASDINVD